VDLDRLRLDICRLLDGARALPQPLRAATHETIFGLLASSGMRIGEAVGLQRDDVDLRERVITIREAKFDRSRLVPLHPTVAEALSRYAAERDRLCPRPRSRAFFISSTGNALDLCLVDPVPQRLGPDPQLAGDPPDHPVALTGLLDRLQDKPNRPLPKFRRITPLGRMRNTLAAF
jgi:hypothetical protein